MAPSRGLEPRWSRLTAGCLPIRPRGCGSRGTDSNLRSPGCGPGALAAELLGSGAGGRFRDADAHAFNVPLYLLSYSSKLDPTRESNRVKSGTRGRTRTPITWFRATCPTVRRPWSGAPAGIEPAAFCSTGRRPLQGTTRARRTKGVVAVRRGGVAPPQPVATGLRPAGLATCPSRRACHHARLALPCLFGFQGAGPELRAKRKGPGVARPLVDSLVSRESSSYSRGGDSGPGDDRSGSCQSAADGLAGWSGVGRRPRPASRLRVPRSSRGLCLSWQRQHTRRPDDLSRCQIG